MTFGAFLADGAEKIALIPDFGFTFGDPASSPASSRTEVLNGLTNLGLSTKPDLARGVIPKPTRRGRAGDKPRPVVGAGDIARCLLEGNGV